MGWSAPTTSPLDTYGRADGGLGPNWLTLSGSQPAVITSGTVRVDTSSTYSEMGWNASAFTGEAEVYLTVAAIDTTTGHQIYLDIFSGWSTSSIANLDGYQLLFTRGASTDGLKIARYDNGAGTDIVSAGNLASRLAAGDQLAFTREAGGVLKGWHKPAAGSWTQIVTVTDTTYFNAGQSYNIGFGAFGTPFRFDDFGGGTIVANGTSVSVTFSAPYDTVRSPVAINSGAWESQQPLSAVRSIVVEATQGVSVTRSGPLEAAGQVQGTVSSPYDAPGAAQAAVSGAWEATQGVAVVRSGIWEALAALALTAQSSWEAGGQASAVLSSPWEAQLSVAAVASSPWDTVLAVAAATSGPYEALLRAALTVSAPWEAAGSAVTPVSQTFGIPWESTAGVAVTWSTAWEAAARLAATLGMPFETVAPLAAILSSNYEAQGPVASSASAAWEALAPLLVTASLLYEARGIVAATLSLPWESQRTGRPPRPDGPPGTGRIAVLLPGRIAFSGQGRIDHGTGGSLA